MKEIAIGVREASDPLRLTDTLEWLAFSTAPPFALRVFGGDLGEEPRGMGACLNRLAKECPAECYVVLESGALPGPHWLEALQDVFRRVPRCGIAGPSTNWEGNRQAIFSHSIGDVARNAMAAKLRFGSAYRSLERNMRLMDFCVAIRREALQAIGPAPETPGWLTAMSIRGESANFSVLWACGAYVHRAGPKTLRVNQPSTVPRRGSGLLATVKQTSDDEAEKSVITEERKAVIVQAAEAGVRGDATERGQPDQPELPLASCIMPTCNRRGFLPRAIRCFFSQDYPNTELIVVDDGTDPIADVLPSDGRIRYYRLAVKQNVGAKRNFACERARGEFIVHWDDDEWYEPSRIRRQIDALQKSRARVIGTSVAIFYNEETAKAYRYSYSAPAANWMGALAYPRSVWRERPFDCVPIAEDVRFIVRIPASLRMDLRDPTLYVASIHAANTSPKLTTGSYWKPEPRESLKVFSGFLPITEFVGRFEGSH